VSCPSCIPIDFMSLVKKKNKETKEIKGCQKESTMD
jgi:hypothetical protein